MVPQVLDHASAEHFIGFFVHASDQAWTAHPGIAQGHFESIADQMLPFSSRYN